ncbi:hypothetical protein D0Z07_2573 [Hyphodiscus hymeniophilus]|uniref:Cell wall proline rich protein n=1 Tax=Hyphodiscus hymeniophilus TaxID=353542 RepID=A0A9P6VLN8_9HELO|nr:hypothetical protein D0Z07_2573 [Hyphodiscus hymeniophilus]
MASIQPGEGSPLPNPPFVFPARDALSSSAPSSYSRASGRRPISAIEVSTGGSNEQMPESDRRRSIPAALPTFSFNPSAVVPETGMASPPLSPGSPSSRNIPSRHRRGTSEFIGGKSGSGMSLMSTSPTKSENSFGPTNNPRRGHAHRRSAAVSAHDLSMILQPNSLLPRGESAPTSPSELGQRQPPFANFFESTSKDETPFDEPSRATSPETRNLNQLNRARVGFSDNVEIIPRPLSLVSSEGSSTATIRGHSVSGSLTSIVSGGTSSPLSREQRASNERVLDGRPKSAGPRLDGSRTSSPTPDNGTDPRRRSSNPLLKDAIPITPTSPRFPVRKWGFFGVEHASGESSPNRSRPSSAASSKENKAPSPPPVPSPVANQMTGPDVPLESIEQSSSRRSSISKKPNSKKKQKKVKSWAGSILSRKTRPRSVSRRTRTPTPPLRSYQPMNEAPIFDFTQNDLPDTILESPATVKAEVQTDFATWRPRQIAQPQQEESMSPIIDLDAALGPFNTPSGRDAGWDIVNDTPGVSKRGKRMHSAAGMGNFLGPGMHYHRRAESAPEFENPRFGLHRLGSSSTMADVFEEDEEDDAWEDTKASSDKGSTNKVDDEDDAGMDTGIKVVDADNMCSEKPMDWTVDDSSLQRGVKRKGSGLSEEERQQVSSSAKPEQSTMSLKDEPIREESPRQVDFADDSIPPRPDSRAQSSDSTATPPFRSRTANDLAPVNVQPFSLQPSYLTPTSPHSTIQSSFPSPRSPFSYDTQRISTAPSSIVDEGVFQSLLLGEPGPELRMSVDDVPSLTSSNSTTTRDSNSLPMSHNPQFRDGQRSASLSSAAVTRKRSSMASLSRLISSSHGEKSKLSIESRAPQIMEQVKKEKGSKSKRISRMMQFWKPNDGKGSAP